MSFQALKYPLVQILVDVKKSNSLSANSTRTTIGVVPIINSVVAWTIEKFAHKNPFEDSKKLISSSLVESNGRKTVKEMKLKRSSTKRGQRQLPMRLPGISASLTKTSCVTTLLAPSKWCNNKGMERLRSLWRIAISNWWMLKHVPLFRKLTVPQCPLSKPSKLSNTNAKAKSRNLCVSPNPSKIVLKTINAGGLSGTSVLRNLLASRMITVTNANTLSNKEGLVLALPILAISSIQAPVDLHLPLTTLTSWDQ